MKIPLDRPLERDEAIAYMTSADSPFALTTKTIGGVPFDVYEHAPNDLRDFFAYAHTHFFDREFLVYGNERLTFGEVRARSVALSHWLVERGVRPGDRVAIAMRNYPEYCIAVEAIFGAGAVAVTLNSWWQQDEMAYGLRDSGARFAFVDDERWTRVEPSLDLLDLGVAVARPAHVLPDGVFDMANLAAPGEFADFPAIAIDTDADAIIMYTSGSTGHPKGVVSTHRNVVSALMNFSFIGLAAVLMQDVDVDSRVEVAKWMEGGAAAMDDPLALRLPTAAMLLNVPLFHVSGLHVMLFMSYRAGRKLVMMHKWDAEVALDLAEREGLTVIDGVPTMVGEILNSPSLASRDLTALTRIGGGGSARPPEHVKLMQDRMPNAIPGTGYGMTETNAIGATIAGEDYVARPASVGRQSPALVSIEIRDDAGNVLGPNEEGEICMKSAANMRCYWNKPEATAETLRDGWVYSGDLGHLDDEGFLFITGRAKDIIIRGGENIACSEIEYTLYEHPAVHEAAVHGAPDDRLGEIVCAVVYLKPDAEAGAEELQRHVREHLAAFKVPAHVRISEAPLQRIASGKFDKRAERESTLDWLARA